MTLDKTIPSSATGRDMDSSPSPPSFTVQEALQVEYRHMASWYDWFWGSYLTKTLRLPLQLVLQAVQSQNTLGTDGRVVVADVACGTGVFLQRLGSAMMENKIHNSNDNDDNNSNSNNEARRMLECQLCGVEPSAEMLEQARCKFASNDSASTHQNDDHHSTPKQLLVPTFWQAPAESLPLEDASIDVVVATNAFHFFGNYPKALQEMRRVLKPSQSQEQGGGGSLIITDWCADYWIVRAYHWLEWLRWNVWHGYSDRYPGPLTSSALQTHVQDDGGFTEIHLERYRLRMFGFVYWGMQTLTAKRKSSSRGQDDTR